ncbi:MAG: metallophosphoesterase [Phycisphaerales bacterium]|nr:metallophosphoesterase [Phycisphaerales bacterium]
MALTSVLAGLFLACMSSDNLSHTFQGEADRRWPGANWYVNRVQDWRVAGGELVCDDSRLPVRTANLLPVQIVPGNPTGPITITTTIAPVGDAPLEPGAFAGILFGAGGPDVDYRLTALVQQVPAPDGGILGVMDGSGAARLLDFSVEKQGGFSWTLPRNTSLDMLGEPNGARGGGVVGEIDPDKSVELVLRIDPPDEETGTYLVQVGAYQPGEIPNKNVMNMRLDRDSIDGGLGLVAHRGERKPNIGWRFSGLEIETEQPGEWLLIDESRAWGPVLSVLYTIDRQRDFHQLNLNALFPPMETEALGDVILEVETRDGAWRELGRATLVDKSFNAAFRVDNIDEYLGRRYRVRGEFAARPYEWVGTLRAEPGEDREMVVGVLNCVKNVTAHKAWNRMGVWFPHDELVARVESQDPDLLYCAGDQIYEGDLSGVDTRNRLLDYHTKYQRWLWAFGELARDRPTIVVPDDHDVFHGNIWGAGGIRAKKQEGLTTQDSGGYKLPAAMVNAIHRTQVGNLPECAVPGPIGQGITPYTTRLRWGTVDAAIVADRMWKDSASVMVPEAQVRNGWFKNLEFDPRDADVEGARLLGDTQEAFLEEWSTDRDPRSSRKLVLSQTPWINAATLPVGNDDGVVPGLKVLAPGEYPPNDAPAADTDSGGWPQAARARGVGFIHAADAIHLAGDQHLASLVQYGIDGYRDGPFVFTAPAVANTFPRRWMPREGGANRAEGAPKYTGDFLDGFGNPMTIWAVANPTDRRIEPRRLYDLSPGYGIVRIDPKSGDAVIEAWPRWVDPGDDSLQFPGWPHFVPAR